MTASATLLSLAEFQALPDNGMRHELSEGELIEMPPPKYAHSHVAHRFYELLIGVVSTQGRGKLLIEAGFQLSLDPPTVRQPDLSYVALERLPNPKEDVWISGGPHLAIEVVSPSDSAEDLNQKVGQYLAAGTLQVWTAYPRTQQVHIHRSSQPTTVLDVRDTLEAPELFPGWSLAIADLFR